MNSRLDVLLWIALPYVCVTIFLVGHAVRFRYGQRTWTARSTQLLESRLQRWGSPLFHFGALAAIGGHVVGLLIPESWTEAVGITDDMYHYLALVGGLTAAALIITGLGILLLRRGANASVRGTTSRMDLVMFAVLIVAIGTGTWATLGENLILGTYEYRETVAPWFRGIFSFQPEPQYMVGAPLVFQVHAVTAFLLFALWPFTRLVHVWSIPVVYPLRTPILYRRRQPAPLDRPRRPGMSSTSTSAPAERPRS